jgi:hypothetical protein
MTFWKGMQPHHTFIEFTVIIYKPTKKIAIWMLDWMTLLVCSFFNFHHKNSEISLAFHNDTQRWSKSNNKMSLLQGLLLMLHYLATKTTDSINNDEDCQQYQYCQVNWKEFFFLICLHIVEMQTNQFFNSKRKKILLHFLQHITALAWLCKLEH